MAIATNDAADAFSFEHDGRTFTCCAEASRGGAHSSMRGTWWWFAVSTEAHQRHAPFPAAADDTPATVRERIISYHDALLARRNAPYQSPWQARARARNAAATVEAPPAVS